MTTLYLITKYLTFPGCFVRGLWEQVVCRFFRVPVDDNRYVKNDETMGHIEHEFMPTARGAFAICFVPCLFNLLGAFIFGLFPAMFLLYIGYSEFWFSLYAAVSYWFAFSLFVNAFPLIEDAANMVDKVYKNGNILQKILYAPGVGITYVGAFLERYGITFLMGIAITLFLIV